MNYWKVSNDAELASLYASDMPVAAIAAHFGICISRLYEQINRLGLELRGQPTKVTLSEGQIEEVKDRLILNQSARKISIDMKVSVEALHRIIRKDTVLKQIYEANLKRRGYR